MAGARKASTKSISVSRISLDRGNVRYGPGGMAGEAESIAHLAQDEKVYEIAKHICEHGINPLENAGVFQEDRGYIVREGNRRVCALKLLNDPDLAPDQKQKKRYEKLAREAKVGVPASLRCHVFANEKAGDEWMKLKHISDQPAGIRPWSADAKAYFDSRSPDRQALLLKQYAIKKGLFSKESIKKNPTTTLTRYLGTPAVRKCIGIVDRPGLWIDRDETTFQKFLKAFLDGSAGKLSSRTSVSDREEYAVKLEGKVPHSDRRLDVPLNLIPATGGQPKPAAKTGKKRPRQHKGIISPQWGGFAYLRENGPDGMISNIVRELRDIDSNELPFATGCLLRMLMECVVRRYLGFPTKQQVKLKELYRQAEQKLRKKEGDHFTQALRQAINDRESPLSPDTQSAWVHGRVIPTKRELGRIWLNFGPIIVEMLKPEAKH